MHPWHVTIQLKAIELSTFMVLNYNAVQGGSNIFTSVDETLVT